MTSPELPKNILVPIDFSPHATQALDYASVLAAKIGAKVHILTVIGVPALGVPELGVALTAGVIDQLVVENQAALDKVASARRKSGAAIGEVMLRTGDARDMILQAAEEVHADLVVMGTHGRRGISRALLGSVAETVVRTCPVPVLTVRATRS